MGVRRHEYFRGLQTRSIDETRRGTLGEAATLKFYETAAGSADDPVLTLGDSDHWNVTKERLDNQVEDVLVVRITHDPLKTSDEVMNRVDRLKVENAEGLEDLNGLLMTARVVQRPSGVGRRWVIRGEEVGPGAR